MHRHGSANYDQVLNVVDENAFFGPHKSNVRDDISLLDICVELLPVERGEIISSSK
jgi:hypothetical protein